MTTRLQQATTRRWLLPCLAAIVAILAIVGLAGTASAATPGTTENRVGEPTPTAQDLVGASDSIAAGQQLGEADLGPETVVATGVAAKTTAKACSFSGATVVLMADGTRKPIEDVKVGDKVIATDPETGEQATKTVEHVWVHGDTVIDLVVNGEVITTTEGHPFWSITDQRFERADELAVVENVLGANGRVITVTGVELGTARRALAYNQSATNATGHAMTYASNVVHTPRAQARATSEAYHSMSNAYAKQRYERNQQDRRYGGPQYNPNSRTSVSSQNYYGNDNGNRAHVHGAPCNPLRLLFDWHSCQDVVSVSCGAEVAMVLPWFKVGKIGKLGIAAKRAHEAERAANGGRRSVAIGEDMTNRVGPFAKRIGADTYKADPTAPREMWMKNNRDWLRKQMDDGCTIYDCGPAPGRANFPNPTSRYYQMELDEIGLRNYPNYIRVPLE